MRYHLEQKIARPYELDVCTVRSAEVFEDFGLAQTLLCDGEQGGYGAGRVVSVSGVELEIVDMRIGALLVVARREGRSVIAHGTATDIGWCRWGCGAHRRMGWQSLMVGMSFLNHG